MFVLLDAEWVTEDGGRACKPCPPQEEETDIRAERYTDEVISVRLLDGYSIRTARKNVVGFCHNIRHPGNLTEALCVKHACVKKQCPLLERYPDASYWNKLQEAEKRRKAAKEEKEQAKRAKKEEAEKQLALKNHLQAVADDAGYRVQVVYLKKENDRCFVFYVSENPFADANRFPALLKATTVGYPRLRLILRHIKDIDGRFVTLDSLSK